MNSRFRRWTESDIQYLKENYADVSNKDIAKVLERTIGAVFVRAQILGLKKSKDYLSGRILNAQKALASRRAANPLTDEERREHIRRRRRERNAYIKTHNPEVWERMLERKRESYRKNKKK